MLKGSIAAAVLVVALTGGAQAASQVPLLDCGGLPCVAATVEPAASLKLLIDTGNAHSMLDLNRAKALGLPLAPVKTGGGTVLPGYFWAQAKNVRVGDELIGDVRFLVMDLGPTFAKGALPQSDGSIAYVDLKDKLLTLDYRAHTVSIGSAGSACPAACGAMTNPTFGQKGPPIVVTTGFRINGQDLTVQVDTLYSGTMLVYPTSVAKLGLARQAASGKMRRFPFTDDGVDMIEGRADEEAFGSAVLATNAPVYFATPDVHVPDGLFDGTVGVELFAGHVVHMDFHAQRFWMD